MEKIFSNLHIDQGATLYTSTGGGITAGNRDTVAAALGVSELHGTKIVPLEV